MKQLYFILILVLLASCQDEEFFEQVEDTTSLSSQSELSNIISRLTQNPTAFDDFIDDTSSLRLEFPFELILNSETTFLISEFADYQILIDELTNTPNAYEIDITFPVNVSLPNYELITVQNQAEFDAITANVEASSEINCLEYIYPVGINIFDADNGFINSRTIQNRAQFYNLTQSLRQTNGFYQILYPIIISVEGQNVSIASNLELNIAIQNLDSGCFNPTLFNVSQSRLQQFIAFITVGEFRITSFIDDDGEDETLRFENFVFIFNPDGTIDVENTNTNESLAGEWTAEIDENKLLFELDFEGSEIVDDLDEEWFVQAFANPNQIELLDEDDDDGEESLLIFERI